MPPRRFGCIMYIAMYHLLNLEDAMKTALEPKTNVQRFLTTRRFSERLCEPLQPEDCVIQSMPDVSPMRWHLAHTRGFLRSSYCSVRRPTMNPLIPDSATCSIHTTTPSANSFRARSVA